MTEPLFSKIKRIIYPLLRVIFGHRHDCCSVISKRCSKCKWARMDEPTQKSVGKALEALDEVEE